MDGAVLPYVLPLVAIAAVGVAAAVSVRLLTGTVRFVVTLPAARTAGASADPSPTVLRRCDACGRGWNARGRLQPTLLGLFVRRLVRRRSASRETPAPAWSAAQGWHRCPTCFSRRVRTSGEPRTRGSTRSRWARLRIWGGLAAALGLLLLALAVLALLQDGGAA